MIMKKLLLITLCCIVFTKCVLAESAGYEYAMQDEHCWCYDLEPNKKMTIEDYAKNNFKCKPFRSSRYEKLMRVCSDNHTAVCICVPI